MIRFALPLLAVLPLPAFAQAGPSFDCRDADTASERAICGSELLSALELQMVGVYDDLAARIGPRAARALADERLARRQACGADASCIAEELVSAMDAFVAAGARAPSAEPVVAVAPSPPPPPPPEAFPDAVAEQRGMPFDVLALDVPARPTSLRPPAEPVAAEPVAPPASETPASETPPVAPPPAEPPVAAAPVAEADPADALPADAPEPARADAADVDTPLGQAWAALPAWSRANVQGRLAEAGYHDGPADGAWTLGTEAALRRFFADAIGDGVPIDSRTVEGAAAGLDFIDSDAFRTGYMDKGVPALAASAQAPADASPAPSQ